MLAVLLAPVLTVAVPPQPAAHAAPVLLLSRCAGACQVRGAATDDARAHVSSLPPNGDFTVSGFAWGDQAWDDIVQCVREVYSPYGVVVTDVAPIDLPYNEVLVAGHDVELGFTGIAGIGPLADDCSPYSNVMSFVFANDYAPDNAMGMCWAVAHETGHAFGLDHAFRFVDGSSACRDPMSYRTDCTVQRFFRNADAICGEDIPRACACGGHQNAHAKLLAVLGPGTPITAPPVVGDVLVQFDHGRVFASARAQRGVDSLELWLNGYRWDTIHPPFTDSGNFVVLIPPGVPDGVIDVVIVATDDLGARGSSETVTVTKGAPCTSADACATGQRCEAGRCLWDPPAGELGDACDYRQFCKSDLCTYGVCTHGCKVDDPEACPTGYICQYTGPDGVCVRGDAPSNGGCSTTPPSPWIVVLSTALALLGRLRTRARRPRH